MALTARMSESAREMIVLKERIQYNAPSWQENSQKHRESQWQWQDHPRLRQQQGSNKLLSTAGAKAAGAMATQGSRQIDTVDR
jgi:hypothetical protein